MKTTSPYLANDWRLADVLAAIQVLGTYPRASRKVKEWFEKLGAPLSAQGWETVFKEHPEFFRLSNEYASLRWRHGYDRTYDIVKKEEIDNKELESLSEEQKNELTRKQLSSDQIETLVKTAVELHGRAIAQAQEKRWLIPLLFGLVGVIVGVLLQAAIK